MCHYFSTFQIEVIIVTKYLFEICILSGRLNTWMEFPLTLICFLRYSALVMRLLIWQETLNSNKCCYSFYFQYKWLLQRIYYQLMCLKNACSSRGSASWSTAFIQTFQQHGSGLLMLFKHLLWPPCASSNSYHHKLDGALCCGSKSSGDKKGYLLYLMPTCITTGYQY